MPPKTPYPVEFVPRQQNGKLALWFYLGSDVVLFGCLILILLVFRLIYPDQYTMFQQHLDIRLAFVNTLALLTSSYLVVRALSDKKAGNTNALMFDMVGIFVLGSVFIGGQAVEWSSLFAEGESIRSAFGSIFYTVTGIHGLHVIIGLIWISYLLVIVLRFRKPAFQDVTLESFGLYWHFVDVVWIILFSLIYLI